MEILLERTAESSASVTCDHTFSHTFALPALLLQSAQQPETLANNPLPYGQLLYAALFPPETLARTHLTSQPDRIVLVTTDPTLESIPWEYTYGHYGHEKDTLPSYLILECPFLRGIPENIRIAPVILNNALHIIAVPSNPLSPDVDPLDIDSEWLRLKESIQDVPYAVTLERTRPATLEKTRQLVANQKGRIIHFMGHGGQNDQGAILCFEQEHGELALVRAQEFVQRLRGSVFLVTLNACVSATPGPTLFSNLAAALVRQKIPYALGMRFSIDDRDARTFSQTLYSELAQGVSLEESLLQARLTLSNSPHHWAIGVPVLYTSLTDPAPGFPCHEGTPLVKEHQPPIEVSTLTRAEGIFQGRQEELKRIGTDLTSDPRPRLLTIHGAGGQGKTALAREVVERFAFAWPGGVWAISLESLPDRATAVISLARFLNIPTPEPFDLTVMEQQVQKHLANRRTLLVLDNAESLVEAVEHNNAVMLDLVAWLKQLSGSSVSLLVTSRVHLQWPGEKVHYLEGLSPEDGAALFRLAAPERTSDISPALASQLSQRIEGHPLSLLLLGGAFNASALSLDSFVQHCEARLIEAENKYIGPEHRHRKLYACIETSVRSLEPPVLALLSGLWIFHAPFFAETAVKTFDPDQEETEQRSSPVREHLHTLWQRSLLTRKTRTTREGNVQFYYLLPTTRPYIEHHIIPTYERSILLKRFGQASFTLVRWIYQQLNYRAAAVVLAQEALEDFERAIEGLEGIERGYYLQQWSRILSRLGNPLRAVAFLDAAVEISQGVDNKLELASLYILAMVYSGMGNPKEALRLYEEALPIQREVGDRAGEGATLSSMAGVYSAIGQKKEALRLYEEALPIRREMEDRAGEGATLSSMAGVYSAIGNPKEALRLYEEALPILREVGDRVVEGATLSSMAGVYSDIGNPKEALRLYEEALPIRREMGDRAGEGATLNNMAGVYSAIGQKKEALRLYEEALPIRREVRDRAGEGATLSNMAGVYGAIGNPKEALRLYEEALPILQEVGDRAGEGATLSSMAGRYRAIGNPKEALRLYEEALPIRREARDRAGEGATLSSMAGGYRAIGNPKEALRLYEEALPIQREVGDRAGEGATLSNMAGGYSDIGNLKEALRLYEEALPISREVGDRAGEGATLSNMAVLYIQLERYPEAVDLYQQSLLLFQQVSLIAGEIAALLGLAYVLFEHLNRPSDAIIYLERAITLFQTTDLPQDAAGNTPKRVQQILERVRNGSSFYPAEDTNHTALIQALLDFINADSWETSRHILETQQTLLFQPEGETFLERVIRQAKEASNESAVQNLELHLSILRTCKREGIAPTFAQLLQAQTTTVPPLPFDAELLQKSIAALLGSPQEKMQHVQYLATVGAATTDEQLKSLLNTIQLALFGGDLLHLGQDLRGAYQQGWQTILLGIEKGETL